MTASTMKNETTTEGHGTSAYEVDWTDRLIVCCMALYVLVAADVLWLGDIQPGPFYKVSEAQQEGKGTFVEVKRIPYKREGRFTHILYDAWKSETTVVRVYTQIGEVCYASTQKDSSILHPCLAQKDFGRVEAELWSMAVPSVDWNLGKK